MVWKAQSSTGYWGDQDPIQAPVSYRVLGDDASTPIGIAVQDQMELRFKIVAVAAAAAR